MGGKARQGGCRSTLFSQLKQFMQIICLFRLFLEDRLEMYLMERNIFFPKSRQDPNRTKLFKVKEHNKLGNMSVPE